MNVVDNVTAPTHVPETLSLQGALDDFQFPVPTSRSMEGHAALYMASHRYLLIVIPKKNPPSLILRN